MFDLQKKGTQDVESVHRLVEQVSETVQGQPNLEELSAALNELKAKTDELQKIIKDEQDINMISEKAIEAEQAADSALKVAMACDDQSYVREVQQAHDEIRNFKRQFQD